jgi:hypothetical protein
MTCWAKFIAAHPAALPAMDVEAVARELLDAYIAMPHPGNVCAAFADVLRKHCKPGNRVSVGELTAKDLLAELEKRATAANVTASPAQSGERA